MSVTTSTPIAIAAAASIAGRKLSILSAEQRNEALLAIHNALGSAKEIILAANALDLSDAKKASLEGTLSNSIVKRLDLSGKYDEMLQGILDVRSLDDPVGKITLRTKLSEGMELRRVTCPIGVLLIIFEARPEVIANITALAIKSGNAAILKGGKESTRSFAAISEVVAKALAATEVPNEAIQLVGTREAISELLKCDRDIDLVIPRGSNDLVRFVKFNTKIPVLGHADGICSIYLHSDADKDMATKVVLDSKTNYPAACNAVETLLVHEDILSTVFVSVAETLLKAGVNLRCDPSSLSALSSLSQQYSSLISPSTTSDYTAEFLDLTLAVFTIPSSPTSLEKAISHINFHSSHHTDAIITSDPSVARMFQNSIDSACVFWNASTRMADGMRFGFGTEVGISTNKIHSRGPVGLEGLVIYKYLIDGEGQCVPEFKDGGRTWMHEKISLE